VLRLAPLAPDSPYAATWPAACALLVLEMPMPETSHVAWMRRMAHRFQLTDAETRVLREFITGADPSEVAARAKLSINTVRSHLKAIFEKTGCHRQAELMRMFGSP
jgi:DNA-binding CsgD family transcriptional regulator